MSQEDKSKEVKCGCCGKSMYNKDNGINLIGMSVRLNKVNKDLDVNKGKEQNVIDNENAFLKKQLGLFELDKEYSICFECLVRNLGVAI